MRAKDFKDLAAQAVSFNSFGQDFHTDNNTKAALGLSVWQVFYDEESVSILPTFF